MAKAGETQPVISMSVEEFVACSDILPPRNTAHIIQYFDRYDFPNGSLSGYSKIARRVSADLQMLAGSNLMPAGKEWTLGLGPKKGKLFMENDQPVPLGVRSLLEMVYSLTDAQITASSVKRKKSTISLNGFFMGRPLRFKETYRKFSGGTLMSWTVRTEDAIPEVQEEIYRPELLAMSGEHREMIAGVEEALELLPEVPKDSPFYRH